MTTLILAAHSDAALKVAIRENITDYLTVLIPEGLANVTNADQIVVTDDFYVGRDGLTYDRFTAALKAAEANGCTVDRVDGTNAVPQL